jgi:peptide/nickel transport system substrate-binding protein
LCHAHTAPVTNSHQFTDASLTHTHEGVKIVRDIMLGCGMRAICRAGMTGWMLTILAGLMLCLAAADASPEEKRRLVLGTATTYGTFDPHTIDDPGQNLIRLNFYDSLLRWTGAPPRLQLWLANRHEISPDGQMHTFYLRPDARFHDGSPVRATDVAYSMERLLALKQGPYALFAGVIAPGGTRANGDNTVVFNLTQPMQGFASLLPELAIVNRALVVANEKNNDWGQEWLQRNSAGSGSYIPFRRDREGAFIASRNHEHFIADWGPNAIDEFEVYPVADPGERVAALLKGDLGGILGHLAIDQLTLLRTTPGFQVVEQPTLRLVRGVLHNRRAPTSNIDFRRALSHAFDYEGLTQGLLAGTMVRNGSPLPDLIWGDTNPARGYRFDLVRAREYLEKVPGPLPEITIGTVAGQVHAEMAAATLKQGLDQLGVKSRIVAEPAEAIFARSHDEKQMFDVLFMAETRLPPDPDPWIGARFGCKAAGRTNYSWFCSEAVDALIAEARRTTDQGARWRNYTAAATLIEADAAELWIGTAVRFGVFRAGISGLLFSPLNEGLDLRWTSIERRPG